LLAFVIVEAKNTNAVGQEARLLLISRKLKPDQTDRQAKVAIAKQYEKNKNFLHKFDICVT